MLLGTEMEGGIVGGSGSGGRGRREARSGMRCGTIGVVQCVVIQAGREGWLDAGQGRAGQAARQGVDVTDSAGTYKGSAGNEYRMQMQGRGGSRDERGRSYA